MFVGMGTRENRPKACMFLVIWFSSSAYGAPSLSESKPPHFPSKFHVSFTLPFWDYVY